MSPEFIDNAKTVLRQFIDTLFKILQMVTCIACLLLFITVMLVALAVPAMLATKSLQLIYIWLWGLKP